MVTTVFQLIVGTKYIYGLWQFCRAVVQNICVLIYIVFETQLPFFAILTKR